MSRSKAKIDTSELKDTTKSTLSPSSSSLKDVSTIEGTSSRSLNSSTTSTGRIENKYTPVSGTDSESATSNVTTSSSPAVKPTVYQWLWFDKYLGFLGAAMFLYGQITFMFSMQKHHKTNPIKYVEKSYFGFEKDVSDLQWRAYSDNILLMVFCIIGFSSLSNLVKKIFPSSKVAAHLFYITFGIIYLIILFRGNLLFWLFFAAVNFLVITFLAGTRYFPAIIWSINLATLYFNDRYHGYNLVDFFHCEALQFLVDSTQDQIIQWHFIFNMTILKMISFGMDKHWSIQGKRFIQPESHAKKCTACAQRDPTKYCLKYRYDEPHQVADYSLLHYASYMFYAPLFITGPPLTFNAFISQLKAPSDIIKTAPSYSLRAIVSFILFEIFVHLDYSFAISTRKDNADLWATFSPSFYFLCSYGTLFFIWLKFNTIWKVAKTWATWDNMEVPENMNRCINNNYNFEGFWRSWHRGFNQWLLRYIYFPLGGSSTKLWNIWVVFTFVAVWHDLKLNLLVWAWGICLCLMPEIGVKKFFDQKKFRFFTQTYWWKYICAIAAATYCIFMCFTNLIGFGMGVETFTFFLQKIFESLAGLMDFGIVFLALVLNAILQFYVREHEDDPEKGF